MGDYLSSTTTAAAYVDPVIPVASIEGQSKVTAKWDESLSNEEKFAKIATQRWIAIYPEGMNGWAEIRRTGYPKLFPVMVNYSQGEIDTDLGPRRLPFTINEKAIILPVMPKPSKCWADRTMAVLASSGM